MPDWSSLKAPSLAEFERLADEAFARLPAKFRRLCEGVAIRVEDFPNDDTLRDLRCESPFDLLGLKNQIRVPGLRTEVVGRYGLG